MRPILLAAGAAAALVVGPTLMAQAQPEAVTLRGSWYDSFSQAPPSTPTPVVPAQTAPAPDVPAGDFPVAVISGQSNKETFLHVDTGVVAGSSVMSYTLTVKEDPKAGNVNQPAAPAKVEIVPVSTYWTDGARGTPYTEAPATATSPKGTASRAADGTWTLDLTPIVSAWASGTIPNNGIAVEPVSTTTPADNFEVVWLPPAAVEATTFPLTTTTTTTPPALVAAAGSASGPTGGLAGAAPAPASTPPTGLTTGPAVPAPSPASSTPPVTTSSPAGGTAPTPAPASHRAPAAAFWLGLGTLIVLAGVIITGLGEAGEPTPPRRGSVLRALERRRMEEEAT